MFEISNLAFEEGYQYFTIEVDGYELEGLFRVHDPKNGKDMTLVSIDYGFKHPSVKEYWGNIEQRLYNLSIEKYKEMLFDEQEEERMKMNNPTRDYECCYYEESLDLNGTADELFHQAKNGYIENPEALAKVQEILSNPIENRKEDAFYVGILKEIVEDKGDEPYNLGKLKLDLLDGVRPDKVELRDGLILEVSTDRECVLVVLSEYTEEKLATGAVCIPVKQFLGMDCGDFKAYVKSVYTYNMIEEDN